MVIPGRVVAAVAASVFLVIWWVIATAWDDWWRSFESAVGWFWLLCLLVWLGLKADERLARWRGR